MLNRKACLNSKILFVSVFECFFGESITFFKAVTYLKFFKGILPEASFFEIGKPNGYSLVSMKKVFGELAGSVRGHNKKALSFILFFKLFLCEFFFNNLDVIFFCKVFY